MSLEEMIEQTIATTRPSKNLELRIAANEHPDRTATSKEFTEAVD